MHVALIIKATRLCNLRCSYCHDWRAGHNHIMTFPVMAAMTGKVLQDPLHDSVEFIWHGGEPTLLGRAFFEKAIHSQARLRAGPEDNQPAADQRYSARRGMGSLSPRQSFCREYQH